MTHSQSGILFYNAHFEQPSSTLKLCPSKLGNPLVHAKRAPLRECKFGQKNIARAARGISFANDPLEKLVKLVGKVEMHTSKHV